MNYQISDNVLYAVFWICVATVICLFLFLAHLNSVWNRRHERRMAEVRRDTPVPPPSPRANPETLRWVHKETTRTADPDAQLMDVVRSIVDDNDEYTLSSNQARLIIAIVRGQQATDDDKTTIERVQAVVEEHENFSLSDVQAGALVSAVRGYRQPALAGDYDSSLNDFLASLTSEDFDAAERIVAAVDMAEPADKLARDLIRVGREGPDPVPDKTAASDEPPTASATVSPPDHD